MNDLQTDREPTADRVVPARHFWPLVPVAVAVGLLFHLLWPDSPLVLRAVIGTIALAAAAAVVVLTYRN